MEKTHNKTAETRMEDPAGTLAVNLLAYADMDDYGEVDRLMYEADRATLGRAITVWYQMCAGERGKEATAQAARIVAQNLQTSLDGLDKNLPHDEYKKRGLPLSFSRGLMLHLCQGELERFTEMWMGTVAPNSELTLHVAAVFLGFARSVLSNTDPAADCE